MVVSSLNSVRPTKTIYPASKIERLCYCLFLAPLPLTVTMPKEPTRAQQPFTSGLGLLFSTPKKKRRNKKKDNTFVQPIGETKRRAELEARLLQLQQGVTSLDNPPHLPHTDIAVDPVHDDSTPEPDFNTSLPFPIHVADDEPSHSKQLVPRRITPGDAATRLYERWASVLPTLIAPWLAYVGQSFAKVPTRVTHLESQCNRMCDKKINRVQCLFQDCE